MTQHTTFEQHVVSFLQELEGGNKSQLTLTAYKTDLIQFFQWLSENNVTVIPGQVTRGHVVGLPVPYKRDYSTVEKTVKMQNLTHLCIDTLLSSYC